MKGPLHLGKINTQMFYRMQVYKMQERSEVFYRKLDQV